MQRILIRVVLATAFIGAGWSIGKAQTKAADFEVAFQAPQGNVKVTCSRGCDWTGPDGVPIQTVTFECKSDGCVGSLNGHGKIGHDLPR